MAQLEVLTVPHPFLKTVAAPVNNFDESLKTLAGNMLETMYLNRGIGLAATQVGVGLRMVVIDVDFDSEQGEETKSPLVLVNPEIVKKKGEQIMEEGCLSVPEIRAEVHRYQKVEVTYRTLENQEKTLSAEGILSICVQHELDHLNGILFIDYLPVLKRKMILKKLRKQTVKN